MPHSCGGGVSSPNPFIGPNTHHLCVSSIEPGRDGETEKNMKKKKHLVKEEEVKKMKYARKIMVGREPIFCPTYLERWEVGAKSVL